VTGVQLHHTDIDLCVAQALHVGGVPLFGEPTIAHSAADEHAWEPGQVLIIEIRR